MSSVKPIQKLRSLASMRRVVGSACDRPAHLLRCRKRNGERLGGRERERQRAKIGITAPLQGSGFGAGIGRGVTVLRFAQLDNSDKGRGIVGVRRDVVDRGHAACQGAIMPGHVGGEPARCQGEDRDRNSAPADRRAAKDANNKGERRNNHGGDAEIRRIAHQAEKRTDTATTRRASLLASEPAALLR